MRRGRARAPRPLSRASPRAVLEVLRLSAHELDASEARPLERSQPQVRTLKTCARKGGTLKHPSEEVSILQLSFSEVGVLEVSFGDTGALKLSYSEVCLLQYGSGRFAPCS